MNTSIPEKDPERESSGSGSSSSSGDGDKNDDDNSTSKQTAKPTKRPVGRPKKTDAEREEDAKNKHHKPKNKKPKDMPRRPLSAYNIFFAQERAKILNAQREGVPQPDFVYPSPAELERQAERGKKKAPPLFHAMARCVGARWRALPPEERKQFEDQAKVEMSTYREKMEEYQQTAVLNSVMMDVKNTQKTEPENKKRALGSDDDDDSGDGQRSNEDDEEDATDAGDVDKPKSSSKRGQFAAKKAKSSSGVVTSSEERAFPLPSIHVPMVGPARSSPETAVATSAAQHLGVLSSSSTNSTDLAALQLFGSSAEAAPSGLSQAVASLQQQVQQQQQQQIGSNLFPRGIWTMGDNSGGLLGRGGGAGDALNLLLQQQQQLINPGSFFSNPSLGAPQLPAGSGNSSRGTATPNLGGPSSATDLWLRQALLFQQQQQQQSGLSGMSPANIAAALARVQTSPQHSQQQQQQQQVAAFAEQSRLANLLQQQQQLRLGGASGSQTVLAPPGGGGGGLANGRSILDRGGLPGFSSTTTTSSPGNLGNAAASAATYLNSSSSQLTVQQQIHQLLLLLQQQHQHNPNAGDDNDR